MAMIKEKCYDSGTIQAFLDGELAPEKSAKVTNHIALCDACALELSEAEEETAFAFSALENEYNTLVPTQRLWTKINDSIVEEKKQNSLWHRLSAFVSSAFLNPSFTIAAGIFVVFGIFAIALTMRPVSDVSTAAISPSNSIADQTKTSPAIDNKVFVSAPSSSTEIGNSPISKAANRQNSRETNFQKLIVNANNKEIESPRRDIRNQTPKTENLLYLPGEESYVKTIATLKQTVDGQKDAVMKPSSRISFERDLAVVNDSIERMKAEVRRDPKNETAKRVLYASYQNKIDLLNSVAARNELMASMQ